MKKLIASLAIIAVLGLTACGTTVSATKIPETQAAIEPVEKSTPTPTPTEDSPKSERGNTIKKFGEAVYWRKDSKPDGTKFGQFSITSVADAKCTGEFAQPPVNGKLIALTIDLQTFPELAQDSIPNVYLSGYSFKYIAANGTTFNGELASVATYSCLEDSQSLKSDFGPAEKAHGLIVLDVPTAGGVLTTGKVEWKLP